MAGSPAQRKAVNQLMGLFQQIKPFS